MDQLLLLLLLLLIRGLLLGLLLSLLLELLLELLLGRLRRLLHRTGDRGSIVVGLAGGGLWEITLRGVLLLGAYKDVAVLVEEHGEDLGGDVECRRKHYTNCIIRTLALQK